MRPLEDFTFKNKAAGVRRWRCRLCCREDSRQHYMLHRLAYRERNRRNAPLQRQRAQGRVLAYLIEHPCTQCGEADPVVLEFHHRDPASKRATLADLARCGVSWGRLEAEIALCDVLCANCHQRTTALQRPVHYKVDRGAPRSKTGRAFRAAADERNTRLIRAYLAAAACVDCGEHDPLVLQFDHLERKTKDVSWLVSSGCSPVRLKRELARCEMRCANCHRRRTARARRWYRTQVVAPPASHVGQAPQPPDSAAVAGRA